jgi:hypothetical protein
MVSPSALIIGKNGMLRCLRLGLLLGTGLGSVAWAQSLAKFDGQYMGELTLTKEITGDCTTPPLGALYPLTISRGEVRFAYRPRFDTTLRGRVGEDGIFKASARLRIDLVVAMISNRSPDDSGMSHSLQMHRRGEGSDGRRLRAALHFD